jgi:hypothetical protein
MERIGSLPLPAAEPERGSGWVVPPELRRALVGLALALNHGLPEEQVSVFAFALKDLPLPLVRMATMRLAQTERFWPKVADVRAMVETLAREQRDAEARAKLALPPPTSEREPTFYCLACLDEPSGWRLWWCPGVGPSRTFDRSDRDTRMSMAECGRRMHHTPHTYAVKCECLPTNPVIAKARERLARRGKGAA